MPTPCADVLTVRDSTELEKSRSQILESFKIRLMRFLIRFYAHARACAGMPAGKVTAEDSAASHEKICQNVAQLGSPTLLPVSPYGLETHSHSFTCVAVTLLCVFDYCKF